MENAQTKSGVQDLHKDVIQILRSLHKKLEADPTVSKKEYDHLDKEIHNLIVGYLR